MADIANGTQFSDLPSCLVIEILVRLPIKALLICRYIRKDWTQLYFSDPYFIRRQLEASNVQFLNKDITSERKFRFGWFVDEVSTGNLGMETLDLSCNLPHDPENKWRVLNSCNGLLCLKPNRFYGSSVYVCNPILGEWVSIPVPKGCYCALGFSAKNNQYKIISCVKIGDLYRRKYEWKIYTLGTGGHWRSIETNGTIHLGHGYDVLDFNTSIHGSLHWIDFKEEEEEEEEEEEFVVVSFDFETERFTLFPLPKLQSAEIECMDVALGVINGCLWANFNNRLDDKDGEMWAMKEYGDEKSWTMMIAMRNYSMEVYDTPDEVLLARNKELVILKQCFSSHELLFTLNEDEMLISDNYDELIGYNMKMKRSSREMMLPDGSLCDVTAYNPSFVSLPDFQRGEQVIRDRDLYEGLFNKRLKKRKEKLKMKKKTKKKLKSV